MLLALEEAAPQPLHVNAAGYSAWLMGQSFARRKSVIFAIEQVVAGNCEFEQNGKRYLLGPGEIFLLQKGGRHLYRVGPAGFLLKRFINISGGALEPMLSACGLAGRNVVSPARPREIERLLRSITALLRTKRENYLLEAGALAYRLLVGISLQGLSSSLSPPLRKVLELMDSSMPAPLDLAALALAVELSPGHLNRIFRQVLKMTPLHYYAQKKMSWACYLLRQTRIPVGEIAGRVGFEDPFYFSARFKKLYGISPRRFRQGGPKV